MLVYTTRSGTVHAHARCHAIQGRHLISVQSEQLGHVRPCVSPVCAGLLKTLKRAS